MRSLKELKGLDDFIKNQKAGEALIDLHGWIMYIPVGYDKYNDLMKTQKDVNKVKSDTLRRTCKKKSQEQLLASVKIGLESMGTYNEFATKLLKHFASIKTTIGKRKKFELNAAVKVHDKQVKAFNKAYMEGKNMIPSNIYTK